MTVGTACLIFVSGLFFGMIIMSLTMIQKNPDGSEKEVYVIYED